MTMEKQRRAEFEEIKPLIQAIGKMDEAYILEALEEEKHAGHFMLRKAAAAAAVITVVFCGGVGVYAGVDFIRERMSGMTEQEKDGFIEELQLSEADADHFSRDFSKSERNRMTELLAEYQNGIFPEDAIKQVETETEVDPDVLCFVASSSTFYLPKAELSNEELLELIDFYYKRDYSLSEVEMVPSVTGQSEISEQEAVTIAKERLETVFDVDLALYEVSTESASGESDDGDFHVLYCNYEKDHYVYSAGVDLDSGSCGELSVQNEALDVYVDSDVSRLPEDAMTAKAWMLAERYCEKDMDWEETKITYVVDSDGTIPHGIVRYCFYAPSLEVIVNYSCGQKDFYLIRALHSDEQIAQYEKDYYEQAVRHGLQVVEGK